MNGAFCALGLKENIYGRSGTIGKVRGFEVVVMDQNVVNKEKKHRYYNHMRHHRRLI
jgi:hypothetical protein